MLELADKYRRGRLSGIGHRMFEHLNSDGYLGHVVPSRYSGKRAAIERYNRLLELANKEGLRTGVPLQMEDFLPGSIGKYHNPYHYKLHDWDRMGTNVGRGWRL